MPTPTKGPRLGRDPAHQRLLLANLAAHLFEAGAIVTTETKAKALRPYAERLITKARRGTVHDRRQVVAKLHDAVFTRPSMMISAPTRQDHIDRGSRSTMWCATMCRCIR